MSRVASGDDFMRRWAEALDLPAKTRRVVIDAEVGHALTVYVSGFGTEDMLRIEPPSASDVKIVMLSAKEVEK